MDGWPLFRPNFGHGVLSRTKRSAHGDACTSGNWTPRACRGPSHQVLPHLVASFDVASQPRLTVADRPEPGPPPSTAAAARQTAPFRVRSFAAQSRGNPSGLISSLTTLPIAHGMFP
jgi:hypothetical protein